MSKNIYNNQEIDEIEYNQLLQLERTLITYQSKRQLYPDTHVKYQFNTRVMISNGKVIALNLSHLNLIQIPPEILAFSLLEHLDLNTNLLYWIPDWIGELYNLKILNLKYNWLSDLPNSFSNFKYLEFLLINANRFRYIPKCLELIPNLSKLDISFNQICTFFSNSAKIVALALPSLMFEQDEVGYGGLYLPEYILSLIKEIDTTILHDVVQTKSFKMILSFYQKSIDDLIDELNENGSLETNLMDRLIREITPSHWYNLKNIPHLDFYEKARIMKQLDYCDFHML